MKDRICVIVGAGDFFNADIPPVSKNDFLIAADGGYNHLKHINRTPDLLIGDFDSLDDVPTHLNIITLNKEKDETDLFAAIKTGLDKGYRQFHIYGGTGGRFDHTLANIQCLAYLSKRGARGYLFGKENVVTSVTNGEIRFSADHKGLISIFSHDAAAKGVTLKGLQYELDGAVLSNDFPLGVSNSFTGKESLVSVKNGTLIVVYHPI